MNVLAIGAHFDDVEIGCGGSLSKFVGEGCTVSIFVATHSGYRSPNDVTMRDALEAKSEGVKASEALGVSDLICGEFETNRLQYGDELVCAILRVIDSRNIDMIFTHWSGDVHQDHRNLALATYSAARHVPRVLCYRSNPYIGEGVFQGNFFIDISATLQIKLNAIKCYQSEMARTNGRWVEQAKAEAVSVGSKIGVTHAEEFLSLKYLF